MAINYPLSLDTFTNPTSFDTLATIDHASQHSNVNDAVKALETKVGVTSSTDIASLDYKTSRQTTKGSLLTSNGTNLVSVPVGADGFMLVTDSTQASGLKYIATTAGGTVTNVSVATANGISGTVVNPTTAPAITLSTSINGMVKANGTGFTGALAGIDYVSPSGFVQGNIVSVTAGVTFANAGIAVKIVSGIAYPTDLTTYTHVDGVTIEAITSGNPIQIDIGDQWKNIPSVTTGNYYTYTTAGVFSQITSVVNNDTYYCPKNGTLIPSFLRTPVSLSGTSTSIGGNSTSSSIYVSNPTSIFWTITNTYSSLAFSNCDIQLSIDNINWTTIVTRGNQTNVYAGNPVTFYGTISLNKIWVRVRTVSGNSTTNTITIEG